ncbi:MAG: hypothetical protein PF569_02325 [Candidatus Woesearchaeota archaeon]|nr:hypothetical protein [Candidatus Woesearchaeota archaeon]
MVDINKMNEQAIKDTLIQIVDVLNELDQDDYFGSEGWEHFFGLDGD